MPMTRITITITDQMDGWVKAQIVSGKYDNDSEYICDLIRKDQNSLDIVLALFFAGELGEDMDRRAKDIRDEVKDCI